MADHLKQLTPPGDTLSHNTNEVVHLFILGHTKDAKGERVNVHLLEHDALSVGAPGEGLGPLAAEVGFVVILVRPPVLTAVDAELTSGTHTTCLTAL